MASSTFPDGSPRAVNDDEYEVLGATWSDKAVFGYPASVGDTSVVYADSSGRQVKFRAGKYAHIHGRGWASGSTDFTKAVTANSSGQPRIDLVVLRLTRSTWLITEEIKVGTPSATPAAPVITQDLIGGGTGVTELPLAYVYVANGATTISAADVTLIAGHVALPSRLTYPSTAALAWILGPVAGQHAVVATSSTSVQEYHYANSQWRRSDWNSAWGVIGGKQWTATGGNLAVGVPVNGGEYATNMDTGTVATLAGRRYQVRCSAFWTTNVTGATMIWYIKDSSGDSRGEYAVTGAINSVGYTLNIFAEWDEPSNASRSYALRTAAVGAAGTYNVIRTSNPKNMVFIEVVDCGPSGPMTTVA